MKAGLLAMLAGLLLACDGGGAPTGSCAYFHYHDYWTTEPSTKIVNGTTVSTTKEVWHHDYICDRYYPAPSDDHGDVPPK